MTERPYTTAPGRGGGQFFFELRGVDVLILAFIGMLVALEAIFRSNLAGWAERLASLVLIGAGYAVAAALLERRGTRSPLLHATLRIGIVMAASSMIYSEMGHIIHLVFPTSWDSVINRMDIALFGELPSIWCETIARPWLTELMMFAYVIYLPLLPAVAWLAYRRAGREGVERYLFALTLVNLLCYVGYFLLPVSGPSRALAGRFAEPLSGYFFTAVTEFMAGNVHLPGGAFPSAHCAASTIFLLAAWRHSRKAGLLLSPVACLIYLSTVYGRFHYVIDAVAGIALALAAYRVADPLFGKFDRLVFGFTFARKPGPAFLNPTRRLGEAP